MFAALLLLNLESYQCLQRVAPPSTLEASPAATDAKFVSNGLIGAIMNSPLKAGIVALARQTMISTAQKAGLNWKEKATELEKATSWEAKIAGWKP